MSWRVTQGSITDPQVDSLLPVDILYSDPPWGDRMLRMFATYVEKATGDRPEQPSYDEVCARYADLIQKGVRDYVFIEVGEPTHRAMLDAVTPVLSSVGTAPFSYGNNHTGVLIYGRVPPGPLPEIDFSFIRGVKGLAMVKYVLGLVARPGLSVLDPCCGAGYTAMAATHYGMDFYGNELNPARLAKTVAYMEAA